MTSARLKRANSIIHQRMSKLEDILATDELFLNYFNEFLSLPSFPEALFFNKNTGWFEIVDGAKHKLSQKIKAAVRASKKRPRIYRAVTQHSFTDLPIIPLEDDFDLGPEEIDTSFTVTTLNKEQGLRWIKDNRFPAFLQSELYIEYRLAKILSQTNDSDVEKRDNVNIQLDYTPHPVKIRPEDIVEEEPEDDSELLLKNMCVCMGEATPTETEAFLSRARLLEGTCTTSSTTESRPISSLVRPDSGLGSLTKLSGDPSSSDEEVHSRLVKPSVKYSKSATPRPGDKVCHSMDELNLRPDTPSWKRSPGGGVYVTPSSGEEEGSQQASYLEELERLAAESSLSKGSQDDASSTAPHDLVFQSVDEMSSVIAGTVIKFMLAEFNKSQPEVYAHHKAVRDTIPDESMREYSLLDIDCASCEWVLETPQVQEAQSKDVEVSSRNSKEKQEQQKKPKKQSDSDEDSVLCSDEDYDEERDVYFRKNKNKKFYPLTCKQGIDDFKQFLKGTAGEKHWMLWLDIDRANTLGPELLDMTAYVEGLRNKYHKKGAAYELSIGSKESLQLTDSSNWSLSHLSGLQNKIAEPLLIYWAPQYIVKHQVKTVPDQVNTEYRNQKSVRISSARRQLEAHPEPRTSTLLPLRPKSCRPTIKTKESEMQALYDGPTPKDFVWQPPEMVRLPETRTPIGHRRTHAVQSVQLCNTHAAGRKQRLDYEAKLTKAFPKRPVSRSSKVTVQTLHSQKTAATLSSNSQVNALDNGSVHEHDVALDVQSKSSDKSEFTGGRRMTALLQALNHEHESGLFFRKYIELAHNQTWLHCIKFWEEVQEYHKLFYARTLNQYQLKKKAKEIFSQYIAKTSKYYIHCSPTVIHNVQVQLSPPYEELFDDSEVYALEQLLQAWESMNHKDRQLLQEVQTKSIVVNLETKSKLVINLQRKGFLRPGDLQPDEDPMENFEDPVYDGSLMDEVPEDFKDFTLEKIIRTPIHLDNLRQFLQSQFATMDLSCWMDIEQLRKMDPKMTEEADEKAREIKQKYFNKKYFFGPNSPASREGLDAMMKAIGGWGKIFPDRPDDHLIIGAQAFVKDRLALKWLPMFLASEQFAELIRPSQQMVDAAEALLLSRQRRNQRLMKMLEGKWVSSSKEIIAFRRSLLNPVISYQFQRFVSVKSDLLENDVLFWRECQKYKHLHHQHTEESFVVQKINVIINCFIATSMDPPLQVDIPQDQAERITEKKRELGPYMFREAQLTVFRVLFEHWADFSTFKSNTATAQILPTIERKRRRAKLKERQRQKELEEQQERENARRRALGLPVEGEEIADDSTSKQKEEEEKSDMGEGPRLSWSYSGYIEALEKEDVISRTNEDTFSCLSGDSGDRKTSSAKVSIEVSDLKDLKAPQTEKPSEVEVDLKPAISKKKQPGKNKTEDAATSRDQSSGKGKQTNHGSRPTSGKGDKKVSVQLDKINRPQPLIRQKSVDKAAQSAGRPVVPVGKR